MHGEARAAGPRPVREEREARRGRRGVRARQRDYLNASVPFTFATPERPRGDALLYVYASLPAPLPAHPYLRVRLLEHDGRVLGHVFGRPDCSGECGTAYLDQQPAAPLLDAVRIPWEDAVRWTADGRLEVAVEIDEPRQALSCAVHPEHPRCFASLQEAGAAQVQAAVGWGGSQYTVLALPLASAAAATMRVADPAALGLDPARAPGALQCPAAGCCPAAGPCRASLLLKVEDELVGVVAVAGSDFTLLRGAANTLPVPHPAGAPVVREDARVLLALDNAGDYTLHRLVLAYAT